MATASDGSATYETTGVGGKFRKMPFRRSIPATPYGRPLKNNNRSMLKKLVDPASRLIYAGAHKLFAVFRKSLPPPALHRPPGVNEEAQNIPQKERRSDSSANIVAATGISELKQMLQEKTFTRSEIQQLTSLLHSRTTESPSNDTLKKPGDVRDNFHAVISTPAVTSKVLEEIASHAELAKFYMGSRPPANENIIQDLKLIQRTPITSLTQKTANSLRDLGNGFVTPRSQGRSAMHTMARTPYARSPIFSQKGIRSLYGHGVASTSSKSVLGHERKMALKRRNSALDDVLGSGGPLRRIRQKANVLSQRDKHELGYSVFQQAGSSQNLVLPNETEPKVSGYASVPAKSTQTANEILQHLEQLNPEKKGEQNSVSTLARMRQESPNKLTLDMLHGQALRSLEKVDLPEFLASFCDIQKPEAQHHARLHEPTSQSKDKTEENGSRMFPVPSNMLTSVNGDSTGFINKAPVVRLTDLPSKVQEEPPQKKHAFHISAPEDSFHDNGCVPFTFVKNNKLETSAADIIKKPALPEINKTHTLVENNNPVLPEVAKVPEQAEVKEAANATSFPNTYVGYNGDSVCEQGLGFEIPISTPSTTTTHSSELPQSTLQMEKIAPVKELGSFSFVKTAENVSLDPFSANKPPEVKPNASSDPKILCSISVNGKGNGNDQKSTNIIGSSLSSSSAVSTSDSTSTDTITTTSTATTAITATTAAAAAVFSTSVPPPVFSFMSASSTASTTSMAETRNNSNKPLFAITSATTRNGLFSFSSPPTTLTPTTHSQGSFFNIANGSLTNTQASSSSTLFDSLPSFDISSLSPSSETKSGNSTSEQTTSLFGSTWQQPQKSSGSSSTFSSSSSSSLFTFMASSTPMPSSVTAGATSSPFAGSSVATPPNNNNNNNDQMSMEDSMAQESMQTPSPVAPFGQAPVGAPGFIFSSANPNPTLIPSPNAVPFQNPFQSSSLEFNAGSSSGNFSLGSGGEKSKRRIVRVVKSKNRKR